MREQLRPQNLLNAISTVLFLSPRVGFECNMVLDRHFKTYFNACLILSAFYNPLISIY